MSPDSIATPSKQYSASPSRRISVHHKSTLESGTPIPPVASGADTPVIPTAQPENDDDEVAASGDDHLLTRGNTFNNAVGSQIETELDSGLIAASKDEEKHDLVNVTEKLPQYSSTHVLIESSKNRGLLLSGSGVITSGVGQVKPKHMSFMSELDAVN